MSTLKLLVPIVAVTIQSNSASTIIPPYLDHMAIPVAAIGSLISPGPIFALTSRLPMGMMYKQDRARMLVSMAVLVMGCTNFLYSMSIDSLIFAVVHSLNGFAYGAVTTLCMAFTSIRWAGHRRLHRARVWSRQCLRYRLTGFYGAVFDWNFIGEKAGAK